jgi:hypothetical protein
MGLRGISSNFGSNFGHVSDTAQEGASSGVCLLEKAEHCPKLKEISDTLFEERESAGNSFNFAGLPDEREPETTLATLPIRLNFLWIPMLPNPRTQQVPATLRHSVCVARETIDSNSPGGHAGDFTR